MGTRDRSTTLDFSGILEEDVESALKEAAQISMGTEISGEDLENIQALSDQVRGWVVWVGRVWVCVCVCAWFVFVSVVCVCVCSCMDLTDCSFQRIARIDRLLEKFSPSFQFPPQLPHHHSPTLTQTPPPPPLKKPNQHRPAPKFKR